MSFVLRGCELHARTDAVTTVMATWMRGLTIKLIAT
jgi:hypothetical protein